MSYSLQLKLKKYIIYNMKDLVNRGIIYFKRRTRRRVIKLMSKDSARTRNFIKNALLFFFCAVTLLFSLRGLPGNPTDTQLNNHVWKEDGPLELSPERGRYVLLYSLAENHSFSFSIALAQFATPDVAYTGKHYASLFAPAVSFIAIPGYLLGKQLGLAQVGSFAVVALFAIFNVFLIRAIAIRLGAHPLASTIAAFTFLFATPAFTYASTLYQHHISTFLILASVYLLVRYNSLLSLMVIWMACAFSIAVDYPNLFMMLPVGIFALGKTFIFQRQNHAMTLQVPLLRVFAIFSVIIPLSFFLWFNYMSYGNPFQLSGGIERAIEVKADGTPVLEEEIKKAQKKLSQESYEAQTSILSFFWNRNMLNGVYSHFLSPDRGMIYFTPVMFLGLIGLIIALRKNQPYVALLVAIMGFNVLLYSMWGDPYGGWAFGSRYLIPTYAILSLFIAIALTAWRKYNLFILLFFSLFSFSVGVNTLGAVTSSRNPPQVEALSLESVSGKEEKYTFQRNIDLLHNDKSKSFIYQTYARYYISAWEYYVNLSVFIIMVTASLIVAYKVKEEDKYAL